MMCIRQWREALLFVARHDNRITFDLIGTATFTCFLAGYYLLVFSKVQIGAFFIQWFHVGLFGGLNFFRSMSIWTFRHYGIYVILYGFPIIQMIAAALQLLGARGEEYYAIQRTKQHLVDAVLSMSAEDAYLCRKNGADNQLRWLIGSLDHYDADRMFTTNMLAWTINPRSPVLRGLKLLFGLGVIVLFVLFCGVTTMVGEGNLFSINLPGMMSCKSTWPLCPAYKFDPAWHVGYTQLDSKIVCNGYTPDCWEVDCKCTNKPFYFPGWLADPNAPSAR